MSNKREKNEGWWKFRGYREDGEVMQIKQIREFKKKIPKLPKFSNC
jgi:hypothetical protein